jgi:hypothetical protein
MATVDFEGIAPNDGFAEVPDGYFGLDWSGFFAFGKKFTNMHFNGIGSQHIIEGKGVGGIHGGATTYKISSDETTFTLKAGTFASDFNEGETFTVRAFRDGNLVGSKEVILDQNATEIRFGRAFRHIDELKMTASGGEDATVADGGAGEDVAMENLIIKVRDARPEPQHSVDFVAGGSPFDTAYLYGVMHPLDWALAL